MNLAKLEQRAPWEWPDSASETLLAIITDDSASEDDRMTAAELSGEVVVLDNEMATALLALTQNASASTELRCTAALSIGGALEIADLDGFDETHVLFDESTFNAIVDGLRDLYHDTVAPTELRRRALETSVRAPRDWHQNAVQKAYDSQEHEWKLTAVFAMRWVSGFEKQILAALDSDDDEIAYEAVCAAGAWEIEEAWSQIEALLDEDTSIPLLLAAIEAAGAIQASTSEGLLRELADSDIDEIAEAAKDALSMIRDREESLEEDDDCDYELDDEADSGGPYEDNYFEE